MKTEPKERGQSMVELALILPFLILLLVATVEAGFALRDYLMVQSANREGARFAVRTPPNSDPAYFLSNVAPEARDRIFEAAEEGGLQEESMGIILTYVYLVDNDGNPGYDASDYVRVSYNTSEGDETQLDVNALMSDNFERYLEIWSARVAAGEEGDSPREVIVVEVFYKHETLWGFENLVGAFGADWTMYAQSTMRMVGTGRY